MAKYELHLNVLCYIEADTKEDALQAFYLSPALTHEVDWKDVVYDVEVHAIQEVTE